jgi:hypothetical protein
MFDPSGLRDRYKRLVHWDGKWVNYWTITAGYYPSLETDERKGYKKVEMENNVALLTSGVVYADDLQKLKSRSPSPSPSPSPTPSPLPSPAASTISLLSPNGISMTDQIDHEPQRRSKHHFITLPLGVGSLLGGQAAWVRTPIAGAEDEVAAHTGLFMRDKNLDYDDFVMRVGDWVTGVIRELQ